MINNELKTLIIESLDNKNIDYKILDNSFNLYLNNYLNIIILIFRGNFTISLIDLGYFF